MYELFKSTFYKVYFINKKTFFWKSAIFPPEWWKVWTWKRSRPDDDDDDGADWDESEESNVLCLFCDETFAKMDDFHGHSKDIHQFNLKMFAKKLQLDSISFIKCVNYVRKNKVTAADLNRFNYSLSQVGKDRMLRKFYAADCGMISVSKWSFLVLLLFLVFFCSLCSPDILPFLLTSCFSARRAFLLFVFSLQGVLWFTIDHFFNHLQGVSFVLFTILCFSAGFAVVRRRVHVSVYFRRPAADDWRGRWFRGLGREHARR